MVVNGTGLFLNTTGVIAVYALAESETGVCRAVVWINANSLALINIIVVIITSIDLGFNKLEERFVVFRLPELVISNFSPLVGVEQLL